VCEFRFHIFAHWFSFHPQFDPDIGNQNLIAHSNASMIRISFRPFIRRFNKALTIAPGLCLVQHACNAGYNLNGWWKSQMVVYICPSCPQNYKRYTNCFLTRRNFLNISNLKSDIELNEMRKFSLYLLLFFFDAFVFSKGIICS